MNIEDVENTFTDLRPGADASFAEYARAVTKYQANHCPVFRKFVQSRNLPPEQCFLPIRAFKDSTVASFDDTTAEAVFSSSGTTAGPRSRHFVKSLDIYRRSVQQAFTSHFGREHRLILAHLPGYEQAGRTSSLACMVADLVTVFGTDGSQTFLEVSEEIREICQGVRPVLLFGAAFGLMSLGEEGFPRLPEGSIVIETGGMKTHRREYTRSDLHARLAELFGVDKRQIWSEYGMCELLSQAYRHPGASFRFPPWVRWKLFDPEYPSREIDDGTGLLAVQDIANMYSVSNILTEDLAVKRGEEFEVIGRLAGSDLRGCNILLEAALDGLQG